MIGNVSLSGNADQVSVDRARLFAEHVTLSGSPITPTDFILPNLIPAKGVTLITAPAKAGKSLFAECLAFSIATGGEYMGKHFDKGVALIMGGEGGRHEREKRINALCVLRSIDLHQGELHSRYSAVDLRQPKNAAALIDYLKQVTSNKQLPVKLVVIDTFSSNIGNGGKSGENDTNAFYASCRDIASELDCAVVVLHHPNKNESGGFGGAQEHENHVDSRLEFTRSDKIGSITEDSVLTITNKVARMCEQGHKAHCKGLLINTNVIGGGTEMVPTWVHYPDYKPAVGKDAGKPDTDKTNPVDDVRSVIDAMLCESGGVPVKLNELIDRAWKECGIKKTACYDAVNALVTAGEIFRDEATKPHTISMTPF